MKDGQEVWQQEDTWTCLGRLADEVGWRRFMVSGSLYFISEPYLFRSAPRMTISERSPGIDSIDYRYDVAQAGAECTVRCRFDRWEAPPGSIVMIKETGPVNGRWIVSKMTRPLFDNQGTITLTKPQPKLPEPALDEEDKFLIPGLSRADQDAAEAIHDPPQDYEVSGNAAELAKQLIRLHAQGKYKDDNGQQMSQIRKIAAGKPLKNAGGQMVYEDSRVLGAIISVINAGYTIGTFAINEDHSHLGVKSQHAKGLAIDISSLGDDKGHVAINSYSIRATNLTKAVMNLLAELDVWDMICNGVGRIDPSVQALQYDNGKPLGGGWESDHTNHIHFGVSPGARDPSSGD